VRVAVVKRAYRFYVFAITSAILGVASTDYAGRKSLGGGKVFRLTFDAGQIVFYIGWWP
jgi:hypothetical protein